MRSDPLVSICIPAFNASEYIQDAIDSAIAQTYANIEILVINDGSDDGDATKELVLGYGGKIKYFEKENGGISSALNLGIRKMKGEYFSWLSHDDVFLPEKTEKQIKIARESNCKVIYADYSYIDQKGNNLHGKTEVLSLAQSDNFFFQFLSGYPINGCTTLIHKEVFEKIGQFDEKLFTTQDYDLWFRCAKEYNFQLLPEKVLKSRIHTKQGSVTISGHKVESDELYTRISRFVVEDPELHGFSQAQVFAGFKFLLGYGYWSGAMMLRRGVKVAGYRFRVSGLILFKLIVCSPMHWVVRELSSLKNWIVGK